MSLSFAQHQRFVALLAHMEEPGGASSIAQFVQDHKLTWDHLCPNHQRLAFFFGMFGSNAVGERRNAARFAAKYIETHGLTYDRVILGHDRPLEPEDIEPDIEPDINDEPEDINIPEPPGQQSSAPEDIDIPAWPTGQPSPEDVDLSAWPTNQPSDRLYTPTATPATHHPLEIVIGVIMIALYWWFKDAFSPTQKLILLGPILAGYTVWWIGKRMRIAFT